MSTIKISNLTSSGVIVGNVSVPVVGNVAGTLTTLKSTVDQLKTFIVASAEANITLANTIQSAQISSANIGMIGYVNSTVAGNVYSNVQVDTFLTSGSFSGFIGGNVGVIGRFAFANVYLPTAANSVGLAGTVAWDTSYFYVCVNTNTWKRVSLSTW